MVLKIPQLRGIEGLFKSVIVETRGVAEPRTDQTPVDATLTSVGSTYETLYTVPTGKIFYLTQVIISSAGSSNNEKGIIGNSGTQIFSVAGDNSWFADISLNTPIKFTSGETVQAKKGALDANTFDFAIVGYTV